MQLSLLTNALFRNLVQQFGSKHVYVFHPDEPFCVPSSRKVNPQSYGLFNDYDIAVFPVCYKWHWTVTVICGKGDLWIHNEFSLVTEQGRCRETFWHAHAKASCQILYFNPAKTTMPGSEFSRPSYDRTVILGVLDCLYNQCSCDDIIFKKKPVGPSELAVVGEVWELDCALSVSTDPKDTLSKRTRSNSKQPDPENDLDWGDWGDLQARIHRGYYVLHVIYQFARRQYLFTPEVNMERWMRQVRNYFTNRL